MIYIWIISGIILWYTFRLFTRQKNSKTLMLILGSGGHTTEILRLVQSWPGTICAVCANSDSFSKEKFLSKHSGKVYSIPRSRNVGQSFFTTIFTTLYSFLPAIWVVFSVSPDLIITNGPGTALPVCYSAFFYKILTFSSIKIVFVESFCRTHTLSLAGKLIYPISNEFYVQWESLLTKYPKAKYIGLLS